MSTVVGLVIGVSGLAVALFALAVVRVGNRKPIPPYVPGEARDVPPSPYPPHEWRQGEPWDE